MGMQETIKKLGKINEKINDMQYQHGVAETHRFYAEIFRDMSKLKSQDLTKKLMRTLQINSGAAAFNASAEIKRLSEQD